MDILNDAMKNISVFIRVFLNGNKLVIKVYFNILNVLIFLL